MSGILQCSNYKLQGHTKLRAFRHKDKLTHDTSGIAAYHPYLKKLESRSDCSAKGSSLPEILPPCRSDPHARATNISNNMTCGLTCK